MRSLRRFLFASPLLFVLATLGRAQITTVGNDQATPVQGAGHDYDKLLSETVQPASGQLSVRIDEPTRPGRGITLPFANLYNSPGVHHPQPPFQPSTVSRTPSTLTLSSVSVNQPTASSDFDLPTAAAR